MIGFYLTLPRWVFFDADAARVDAHLAQDAALRRRKFDLVLARPRCLCQCDLCDQQHREQQDQD